jgi:hypothetical protein
MTPKEKAKELVDKFGDKASMVVDEIIKSNPNDPYPGGYYETEQDRINSCIYYWQEVKQEIQAL